MHYLVTGGSGFIGRKLVARLLADGEQVTVFDLHRGDLPAGAEFLQGSVTDRESVMALTTKGFDSIVHMASLVGVKHYVETPLKVLDVNVLGTRWMIDLALASRIPLMLSSTSEVFGKNPKVPWSEESDRVVGPTSIARWSYSSSKALCEHLLHAARVERGLQPIILRYFNVYGPGQEPIFVVSAMAKAIAEGRPPEIFDGGVMTRCFTFIDDAVDGTVRALRDKRAIGESFNIGSTRETTVSQLAASLLQVAGRYDLQPKAVSTVNKYGSSYEDLLRRVPNTEKAKRLLGWSASTPLEEGLRRTYEWFRQRAQMTK